MSLRPSIASLLILAIGAAAVRADPKVPATSPATTQAAVGCTTKVKSAKVDKVMLRPRRQAAPGATEDSDLFTGLKEAQAPKGDEQPTDDKLLVVELEVVNGGQEKCVYHSLNGSDVKCPAMAVLHDNARHVFALANFGELDVVGSFRGARTLKPGESITDVLVFEVPPKGAKGLQLLLPKENLGRPDRVEPLSISPTE